MNNRPHLLMLLWSIKNNNRKEFPAGLVVKTQCFHHCGLGLVPSLRSHIRLLQAAAKKVGGGKGKKEKNEQPPPPQSPRITHAI